MQLCLWKLFVPPGPGGSARAGELSLLMGVAGGRTFAFSEACSSCQPALLGCLENPLSSANIYLNPVTIQFLCVFTRPGAHAAPCSALRCYRASAAITRENKAWADWKHPQGYLEERT